MELEKTAKQRLEELQKQMQEEAEKRKKQLMKREVPTRRTLKNALATMTRQELDDIRYNVNGSVCAIEGITSPDGRILGKMGHSERKGDNLYANVPFKKDQLIFESGVKYFK